MFDGAQKALDVGGGRFPVDRVDPLIEFFNDPLSRDQTVLAAPGQGWLRFLGQISGRDKWICRAVDDDGLLLFDLRQSSYPQRRLRPEGRQRFRLRLWGDYR